MLQGQWLGPYSNLILPKGLFYPVFIAASFMTGIPVKVAEQLVYLTGSGLFAAAVFWLSSSRLLALLVFGLLAFNPMF